MDQEETAEGLDPDIVRLINDTNRVWRRTTFTPVSGFWIHREGTWLLGKVSQHEVIPEDARIEPNAWDHEHCKICGASISTLIGDLPEGFTDGDEWLCVRCFERNVLPRLPA